jgi:type II secretory pathway pseudopilin PulG
MSLLLGLVSAIALSAFVQSVRNARDNRKMKEALKSGFQIDIDEYLDSYLHKFGEAE